MSKLDDDPNNIASNINSIISNNARSNSGGNLISTSTTQLGTNNSSTTNSNKITLDQIASCLLKQNYILTALEFHTELAENGRELPRLRDFFSNPANFEQPNQSNSTSTFQYQNSSTVASSSGGFYPLHRASSIQTFDSLDLTRYSDDVDTNKFQDDKIAVLEFELRKAKETINQLRNTLTIATESNDKPNSINQSTSSLLNQTETNFKQILNESKVVSNQTLSENVSKLEKLLSQDEDELDEKSNQMAPHDKNAINFLINEYLLENNYKMTSITFSEENETLDLEDWDVIGLNRSKPPNLYHLYKLYLGKKLTSKKSIDKSSGNKKSDSNNKLSTINQQDNESQTDFLDLIDSFTNTDQIVQKDFDVNVNFDHETFDNQRMQINKLLEKQDILLKSITKLESDISNLNSEREMNLKKIDLLTLSCEKANTMIRTLNDEKLMSNSSMNNSEAKHDKFDENSVDVVKNNVDSSFTSFPTPVDVPTSFESLELFCERKIPVVFKELLNKYSSIELNDENRLILEEISKLKISNEEAIELLFKYLPIIKPVVSDEKRLYLLPLVLLAAVIEQEQSLMNDSIKKDSNLLKLLFNLVEKPNNQQRLMLLNGCIQYIKLVGPTTVNNFLLSECWEQINDKNEERRILVAESCFILAPYINADMRSSLMFSILKQIIELEKSDLVREHAVKSLSILINYIKDEQKFIQCIDLLHMCVIDSSDGVLRQVEQVMMPSMCLWAMSTNKFDDVFLMSIVNKIDHHLLACNKQKYMANKKNEDGIYIDHEKHSKVYLQLLILSLQFVFAYILINFREKKSNKTNKESDDEPNKLLNDDEESIAITEDCLSKLNAYYHSLQEKLSTNIDLYKLDSILEDYLFLTRKYLNLIETDSWSSDSLSSSFTWLGDVFLRKLIQMTAQIEARDPLCPYFVKLFENFVLLFAIDYEFINSKLISIFEKLLNIQHYNSSLQDSDSSQQNAIEQLLHTKSCTLFRATLPVYFVGILSTLLDVELYGWFNLNLDISNQSASSSSNNSFTHQTATIKPTDVSPYKNEKVINSSKYSNKKNKMNGDENENGEPKPSTQFEKRLDYMNNYLKNVFFTLSLNQTNLDGLISIYELMKAKSKTADYVIQMLLSTLWDGIVHMSLYVRCNTAKLFEILVKDCDEYLLSTRILPALITLANDLDKMVRCSSISPLTSIIENCSNKEILERVFTQLQSFLSDPILKDEYLLQIELLKTFRRISTRVNHKFREELILPYLTILTLQIKNVITDNDYEFTLSSLTSTFLSITVSFHNTTNTSIPSSNSQLFLSNSSTLTSIASSTSTQSIKDLKPSSATGQPQTNQQQDIQKILALLFENYKTLCLSTNNDLNISRQSIQESLLPGLSNLKDIFQHKIIINQVGSASSNNISLQNDFVAQLDNIIHKLEQVQHDNTNISPIISTTTSGNNHLTPSSILNDVSSTLSASPIKISPMSGIIANGINLSNAIVDTVVTYSTNNVANTGNGVLSSLASSSNSSISSNNSNMIQNGQNNNENNANFKSIVFKGINNFKDQSKDKLSNFQLANKLFKK